MNMDWTTKLSKKEWSIFLRNDVQLPAIAHGEIEYLAGKLARRSQTIGDFTQLTEQQLEKEYQFDRQGLLNRIKKWQTSVSTHSSVSTNIDHPRSPSQSNSLVALISFIMTDINNDHVTSVLNSVDAGGEPVAYDMIENYRRIINACKKQCEKATVDTDKISLRCKRCGEIYEVPRNMRFLALLPVCFRCQEDWLDSLYKKYGAK